MKYQDLFMFPVEWLREVDRTIAETVSDWADQEVMSGRLEHKEDREALLEPAIRKLFVDIGLQGMVWPEEAGGAGLGTPEAAVTLVAVLEQIGRADTGIGFLFANTFAVHSTFGIEPHVNRALTGSLAPTYCEGGEPALASLILPGYGSLDGGKVPGFSGLTCQVRAASGGGGWVLTGERVRPQCSGVDASLFGAVCEGEEGETLFVLVPGSAEGLARSEPFKKTGLAASLNADLDFEDVNVPEENLVFAGTERLRSALCFYYLGCSATCVGSLMAAYEILKEWSETRVIKGKGQVFKENPLVAALLGEVGARIGISRILVYNLARMLAEAGAYGSGPSIFATATAVFKEVTGNAVGVINNAMELMGSAGYATEWNLERYWRDVKTIQNTVVPETAARVDMARHYFGCQTL